MKSNPTSVTIEEIEDEDDQLSRNKPKLPSDSPHIMMDNAEYNNTQKKKAQPTRETTSNKNKVPKVDPQPSTTHDPKKGRRRSIPVKRGNAVRERTVPDIGSKSGPTLHTWHEFQGIDRATGEILV